MENQWNRLDNAAKIFPSSSRCADTQVFRFSCELYEEIRPELLQEATDYTISCFEFYRSVMKRGFFWYYLEDTNLTPTVREEYKQPCSPLYSSNHVNLLFEVTYYKNRINLEVYHVLSDGTGAMNFLRTLVSKYLTLAHDLAELPIDYNASPAQMMGDSFSKYYSDTVLTKKKSRGVAAYRLHGAKYSENRIKIITAVLSTGAMLTAAREHGVTLTVFLTALLTWAIGEEMSEREKKKPVTITIPVNLRKFFPSESARNFFALVYIEQSFKREDVTFDKVLKSVEKQFEEKITRDNMWNSINSFSSLEHNVFARIIPLHLKDIILKIGHDVVENRSTAAISNLGIVKLDDSLAPYIRTFDVCTGTNKIQICACSYADRLSLSFTAPFVSADIQRRFLRRLSELGIEVEITSNFGGKANEAL